MKTANYNRPLRHARYFFCLMMGLLLSANFAPLHAQQTTGSIVGTVKDESGAVVSTATVQASSAATGFSRTVKTNDVGEYRIDNLPVGQYTVKVEANSFKHFVQQNLDLTVEQTLTLDVALSAGAATETVTVTSAPPAINTSTAELGRVVESEEILGLPLVNRNAYAELSLTPGVIANSASPYTNPTGSPNFVVGLPSTDVQVNGSLDSGNGTVSFYLDGGNNITGLRNYGNSIPNPSALEEFRVETNAFGAQYGQFSGAVVTVLTKSGTNKFHGELFEFNRNTDYNAFPWRPSKSPITGQYVKSPYHRNNFGGTIGGPILHDKSFFFFSYAGLRQITGATVSGALVPTAAERLGDFTADAPSAQNPHGFYVNLPGTKTTVDGTNSSPNCQVPTLNCIPSALLDPTAANFLNVNNKIGVSIPLPTGAATPSSGGGQYIGNYNTPTDSDEYLAKYDENFGSADHFTATYFYLNTTSAPAGNGGTQNINWTEVLSHAGQTNVVLSDAHTFNSSIINQVWLTFTRAEGGRTLLPVTGPANQTLGSFGSNFLIQGPAGLPYINVSGAFGTGNPNAGPVTGSNNYELRDMVTINKGKHNLSIGGEFSLDKTNFLADLNNYGDVGFAKSAPTSTGNAISDFITGQTSSFEQDSTYVTNLSTWHVAAFAQDNYRITPKFTANLGIRWDIDTPPVDAHNRTASFVPGQQSLITPAAPLGQLFPGDKGIGRGIISTEFNHVSPRVGFAFDPFGDGKSSIRGAAGIFFGIPSGNEWNQPGNAAPYSIRNAFGPTPSLTNVYGGPAYNFPSTAPGGGIFPYTYTPSAPRFYPNTSIEAISPNVKYPTVYQFNLSVQRQLPYKISLTIAYAGTQGRHLTTFVDANYVPYSTLNYLGATVTPTTASSGAGGTDERRQFDAGPAGAAGTLTGITDLLSTQTSNYNGLQISASKAFSHGFSVSGFYVWSRSLESSNPVENGLSNAQDFGYFGGPFTPSNNKLGAVGGGLGEEFGPLDQNHDSNAVISGIWKFNYYKGTNKFVNELVNGWQVSPVLYLISGGPFTVSTGSNNNDDSAGQSRPNQVPGVNPKLDPHRCRVCSTNSVTQAWFNNAAFTANGPGKPGGIGPGGADGNVTRDSLTGPGFKDLDLGVFRDINFPRGIVFQLRAEATNALNWVSLSQPSSGSLTSANQGTITSAAGTQRVIQFGGRLTF